MPRMGPTRSLVPPWATETLVDAGRNLTPPTPGADLDRPFHHLRREEEGVYDVHDWAEVRCLYGREYLSKSAIAKRLGMSCPTVIRFLERPTRPATSDGGRDPSSIRTR